MIQLEKKETNDHLYLEVYRYYRDLIKSGKMLPGSKMPSLRKCSQELKLSRTTIENAYLQLAADGYILAKAQSGYYVTEISVHPRQPASPLQSQNVNCRFDFSSAGVDKESFRFDLWSRYIKSALRQDQRMLTYGEVQGEKDLRQVLADYIRQRRNIQCSPEDIVVGASVQCLLQVLCPLLKDRYHSVSFPNPSFVQGSTIFQDFGFQLHYRDKDSQVIYVSPAHMTKWGEIMPVSRRLELLKYASQRESLIIEDDYENEFVYLQKPTPSLFGLSGGQDVVYIGSFSRLLLPSIRISFMVLPPALLDAYRKKAAFYNQTASKAEQIALCQFIRDGHLASQTRKLKRLYAQKGKQLCQALHTVFGTECSIKMGPAGTSLALTLPCRNQTEIFHREAEKKGLRIPVLSETADTKTFLLSYSAMAVQDFLPACHMLKDILQSLSVS